MTSSRRSTALIVGASRGLGLALDAALGIEDSIPRVVDTIASQSGKAGLRDLDDLGQTVRW